MQIGVYFSQGQIAETHHGIDSFNPSTPLVRIHQGQRGMKPQRSSGRGQQLCAGRLVVTWLADR